MTESSLLGSGSFILLQTLSCLADSKSLRALPCVCKSLLEISKSADAVDAYRLACSSSNTLQLSNANEIDLFQAYGNDPSWRKAYLDNGASMSYDCVRLPICVAGLKTHLLSLQRASNDGAEEVNISGDGNAPDSDWYSATAGSEHFYLGGSQWQVKLQLHRATKAVGLYLVNIPLLQHQRRMTQAQLTSLRSEGSLDGGNCRVAMSIENGCDTQRARQGTFCHSYTVLDPSRGWKSFLPASLLASEEQGYRQKECVNVVVRVQWWLGDIAKIAGQSVTCDKGVRAPHSTATQMLRERATAAPELYYRWQKYLCEERSDEGWECTAMNSSKGELLKVTPRQKEWLDKVCKVYSTQSDDVKQTMRGRAVKVLSQMSGDTKAAQKYLHTERHFGVTCDGCGAYEFEGTRMRCMTCAGYDLCGDCVQKKVTSYGHRIDHMMVSLPTSAWGSRDAHNA